MTNNTPESPYSYARDDGTSAFRFFCDHYPTDPDDVEVSHLQDYLYAWFLHGDAVETAGGDYLTYLRIAIHAIDRYVRNPRIIDYSNGGQQLPVEREVQGILDPSRESAAFLDQDFFNHLAWEKSNGRHPPPSFPPTQSA